MLRNLGRDLFKIAREEILLALVIENSYDLKAEPVACLRSVLRGNDLRRRAGNRTTKMPLPPSLWYLAA
jgi:hypothetical protein